MYLQVHCTQLSAEYEFIMKKWSYFHQISYSSLLWLILSAFLTYFWLYYFTEYVELHQFSLDIQCTWSFLCLLSFWLFCFLNQVLILVGKCSWGRFCFNFFFNCSAFLIERNNSWNRNPVTSGAMHWNTFLSFTKNSCMFLWSHLFSPLLKGEYWHFLNWLGDSRD